MSEKLDLEVKQSTWIRAPREKVYDAFATAGGLNAWFTTDATIDARPGGAMRFKFVGWGAEKIDLEFPGRVIEAERPSRFVFAWGEPHEESIVEIDLEEQDGGTLVRLREHGFRNVQAVIGNAGGWGEALTLWKFWVEHGIATYH
jgi:glutathione S-transferase